LKQNEIKVVMARLKRAMTDFRILPDQTNPEPL
jgi:hypothetical protein